MAKGRNVRGPYSRPSRPSSSPSSCHASCGRRRGLASMQPRAKAAIGAGRAVAHQLGHAGRWPARCRCRARPAAWPGSRAGTGRGTWRPWRAADHRAALSSTSRPGPARARPDGSARARRARRRGPPRPGARRRWPRAAAATSTPRPADRAPPGKRRPHLRQAGEAVQLAEQVAAPLGAGARVADSLRARAAGESRRGTWARSASRSRRSAAASRSIRSLSAGSRASFSRPSAGLVQVGDVAPGGQCWRARAGPPSPWCRCQRAASFANAAARACRRGSASGWVSLASRR